MRAVRWCAALAVLAAACSDTEVITVPTTNIQVAVSDTVVELGDSLQLQVSIKDDAGNELGGRTPTWSSSDPTVLTVSDGGWIVGAGLGSAWARVQVEGIQDSARVDVLQVSVQQVEVTADADTLVVGGLAQAAATPRDRDGNAVTGRDIAWSSEDTAVVVVNANGFIVAVGAGTADVVAESEGIQGAVSINVPDVMVATGWGHTCAVKSGAALCWGRNDLGQLGDAGTSDHATPTAVAGGQTFTMVSVGEYHSCGVTTAGEAYCWGGNDYGQLGDGSVTMRTSPRKVLLGTGTVLRFIGAGDDHTCGLDTTGSVLCWGSNEYGQLGDGSGSDSNLPVSIDAPSGATFVTLVVGTDHNCALTDAEELYCWGGNGDGQLGDGTKTDRPTPILIASPGAAFRQVSPGAYHTCAVTTGHEAYCWGGNGDGQIGDGTTTRRKMPTLVSGGLDFASISARGLHTCAITTSGDTYCWGDNEYGQHGNNTIDDAALPAPAATGLALASVLAGDEYTCGLTATDALYCWGSRSWGRLGDGRTAVALSPVALTGGLAVDQIDAGAYDHSCAATQGATSAYCWGLNVDGQLGTGDFETRTDPVAVAAGTDTIFAMTVAGGSMSCGITGAGRAFCWGGNWGGQLGDGTSDNSATPVAVAAPAGVTFTKLDASYEHVCALADDGDVYCWGYNSDGQVGDGTFVDAFAPEKIGSGAPFVDVAVGGGHSCAVSDSGSLYCWGGNGDGQLGDGTTTGSASPIDVTPAGTTITQVAAGNANTCAITSAGVAYCWGANWDGAVGNGTTSPAETTPQQVSGGHTFGSLSVGQDYACGITTGGAALCWGWNDFGQFGNGTTLGSTTPTAAATGLTLGSISAGYQSTCGVTNANVGHCWGGRRYGSLGDGQAAYALDPVAITLP